jgi:putative phosphoesterase
VRLAIVSDTHLPRGRRRIPERCWTEMAGADLIVHAGDFTALEVLYELDSLGPPLAAVHGNVDSVEVRERLPEARVVDAGGARIAIVHDAGPARGRLARMRRRFPDVDAVIFGHSHVPLHESDGDFQLFNPGSPTDRRRQPLHTMGIARVSDGVVEFELLTLDHDVRRPPAARR